jgi:hypothetical protein
VGLGGWRDNGVGGKAQVGMEEAVKEGLVWVESGGFRGMEG